MEFERSIYRVHERLLKGANTKSCLNKLTIFFGVMTIFSLVNLCLFHSMFVDDNSVLKKAIEHQLKPYFYKQMELRDHLSQGGNENDTIAFSHTDDQYRAMPEMKLNYSKSNGKFIFDTGHVVKNDTNQTKLEEVTNVNNSSPMNETTASNKSEPTPYNVGIRREDVFYIVVMKEDGQANALRRQKDQGSFNHLSEYKHPSAL